MGRRLTEAEWQDAKAPLYFIKVENKEWTAIHRDMIVKWLEANIGGWFYYDHYTTYAFEKDADRVLFKLWIADDPVGRDAGAILQS